MPFCLLSPTLPASTSANKSPRTCYECSLSPSCHADARGVPLPEKLGRAHPRFLTAKSLRNPRARRSGKNLLSGIWLKALAESLAPRFARFEVRTATAPLLCRALRQKRLCYV